MYANNNTEMISYKRYSEEIPIKYQSVKSVYLSRCSFTHESYKEEMLHYRFTLHFDKV